LFTTVKNFLNIKKLFPSESCGQLGFFLLILKVLVEFLVYFDKALVEFDFRFLATLTEACSVEKLQYIVI